MSTIYVDPAVLLVASSASGPDAGRLSPDAEPALRHVRDAGHRIVFVGGAQPPAGTTASLRSASDDVVDDLPTDATGWLVSSDPAVCSDARPVHRLRTILVGPTAAGQDLAHRPSDIVARDLLDAVLAILTAEAMPTPSGAPDGRG